MSAMELDNDASTVLAILRSESDPELTGIFYTLEDLYERKLWHQLTESLIELYSNPKSEGIRLKLFSNFISHFQSKINQLKLIDFLLISINECADLEEGLSYLQNLKEVINGMENEFESYIYINIQIANVYLKLKKLNESSEILEEYGSQIESMDSINNKINSSYYFTKAELYQLKLDYTNYYRTTFLYLACIDLSTLSLVEKKKISYDLSISAILGDLIYNFGEFILHDIFNYLQNTEFDWLNKLILALNSGNLNEFDQLLANLNKAPILVKNEAFLRQKMCIMSLIELISLKPSSNRNLTFTEISSTTGLDIDDVEHLVMKALSLGLIKGFINQVDEIVLVNWVQPRVLNLDQIKNMHEKLNIWDENVKKLGDLMQNNGKEIWASV